MESGQVEILSPAGSLAILKGAFAAGADAVYAGGSCFGARAFAQNFTEDEMLEGIDYAHLHGRKLYLTVNTLVKEKEFGQLYRYLLPFYRQGLDAVIVQDMGVMEFVRREFPGLAIHASTQMTVTGARSAGFLEQQGVTRVVPARELSLAEIRRIRQETDLEIECFVHGALCYCYSGRCLMSSLIGGRSGNRGQCAQPCRLAWTAQGQKKSADILSLKDLCTIDMIPQLVEAGITSFKIEGRMKQPSYVETVTALYRKYTNLYIAGGNGEPFRVSGADRQELMDAYRRRGYTDGYYRRHNGREMISFARPEPERERARTEEGQITEPKEKIKGKFILSPGKRATLTLSAQVGGRTYGTRTEGDEVQEARNKPMSEEQIRKQAGRTGNTPFAFRELDIRAEGNIFLPVQSLNALRRTALKELERQITESFRRPEPKRREELAGPVGQGGYRSLADMPVFVSAMSQEQAETALLHSRVKRLYLADTLLEEGRGEELLAEAARRGVEVFFLMPQICRAQTEDYYRAQLAGLEKRCDGAMACNLEELLLLRESGFGKPVDMAGSAYSWNRLAQQFWHGQGAALLEAPAELHEGELRGLDRAQMILPVYGYQPVMVSAGCVRKNTASCTRRPGWTSITDRRGKRFMVRVECQSCYNVIYNTDPLVLADQRQEIERLAPAALLLSFTWENKKRTKEVLDYFEGVFAGREMPAWDGPYTRGHFRRGVK